MTATAIHPAPGASAPGDVDLPPDDLFDEDVWDPDRHDELPPMSRIDALEWELWAGVEQDEAEREMLRLKAPPWVFLPPGAELAAALEPLRPQCESPIALIEAMKAAARTESWAAAIKTAAMASFARQRKAQLSEIPRPTELDSTGRPIDPERSWAAEIAAALHLAPSTAARHLDTALHLTSTLTATHTALRCGALTFSKALAISEATRSLPDHAAQAVEAHVLRRAPGQTHKNLTAALRRQVAKHTAKEEADRHREAVADRTCKIVPLSDGMAGLWVVHTADKIQQMWVVIQAMADLAKRGTPTPNPTQDTALAPTPASAPDPARGFGSDLTRNPAPDPTRGFSPDLTRNPAPNPIPNATRQSMRDPNLDSRRDPPPGSAQNSTSTGEPLTGSPNESDSEPVGGPDGTAAWYIDRPTTPTGGTIGGTIGGTVGSGAPAGEPLRCAAASSAGAAAPAEATGAARDERIAPQRRADAIADLFEHMLHNGLDWLARRLPDQHRRRPHIEVLTPITTLLGIDDDPCELTGYGSIPADMARRIATDATWRRLLTDPTTGTVLEASTTRHNPGALVTETLLARHPVCAWPGCNRTSRECDRDHATPFRQTGRTNLTGMVPYCEYHHVIKDTPTWGWTTTTHPDGSVTLTTPTGHRYTTVPPARGPIATTATTDTRRRAPSGDSVMAADLKSDPVPTSADPRTTSGTQQSTDTDERPPLPAATRPTTGPGQRLFPSASPQRSSQQSTADPPPF